MKQGTRENGFTLVESMIATVVLAIIVLSVSVAVTSGQKQMHEAMHAQRAIGLAEELLESILALPYHDPDGNSSPGPEADELSVSDFDNADDFHGYSEQAGEVMDAAGVAYPVEYQLFSREVTAQYDSHTVPGLGAPIAGLTVAVTVRDKTGRTWSLTHFFPEPVGAS